MGIGNRCPPPGPLAQTETGISIPIVAKVTNAERKMFIKLFMIHTLSFYLGSVRPHNYSVERGTEDNATALSPGAELVLREPRVLSVFPSDTEITPFPVTR